MYNIGEIKYLLEKAKEHKGKLIPAIEFNNSKKNKEIFYKFKKADKVSPPFKNVRGTVYYIILGVLIKPDGTQILKPLHKIIDYFEKTKL